MSELPNPFISDSAGVVMPSADAAASRNAGAVFRQPGHLEAHGDLDRSSGHPPVQALGAASDSVPYLSSGPDTAAAAVVPQHLRAAAVPLHDDGGVQESPAVVPQYPTTTAGLLERILEEVLSFPPIVPQVDDDDPAPKFLSDPSPEYLRVAGQ